jgi:hypothetical protein
MRVKGMTRSRISSRPASMPSIRSHVPTSGTSAKVQQGPMLPKPGPTPPSAVAAPPTLSGRLRPVSDSPSASSVKVSISRKKQTPPPRTG